MDPIIDRVCSEALDLSIDDHIELQDYFLQWAPGLPPHHVRCMALGLTEFLDTPWSRKSPGGEVIPRSATNASNPFPNAAIKQPLPPTTPTTPVTAMGPLSWNTPSATSSGGSIWSWTADDELAYATRLLRISDNEVVQGGSDFLDLQNNIHTGDAPAFPPGLDFGREITSADDAFRRVQEVKSVADMDPVVDVIEEWADECDYAELQDFRHQCQSLARCLWTSVSHFIHLLSSICLCSNSPTCRK